MIFRIASGHFTAGGVILDNAVTDEIAPILRYMIGWSQQRVVNYCREKGWTLTLDIGSYGEPVSKGTFSLSIH